MKKSLLSVLLVCSLTLTAVVAPSVAAADNLDEKIEQSNNKINELKGQQADAQAKIDAIQAEINSLNKKGEELTTKQMELATEAATLQNEIEALNKRIEKREVAIQKQARDVQVNGQSTNFIEAVVNADSVSDAITRVQAMTTMVKANNDLVTQQKEDKKAVEAKKAENEKMAAEIEANAKIITDQINQSQTKQAEVAVLKADLQLQQNTEEGNKAGLEQQKAAAEAEAQRVAEEQAAAAAAVQAAEQQQATQPEAPAAGGSTSGGSTGGGTTPAPSTPTPAPTPTPTPTPTPVPDPVIPPATGGGVVGIALAQVGKPYGWGATGPNSFDCSGLVMWSYAQIGRSLPRTAAAQGTIGTAISPDQAQAGDLLFFGSYGAAYHVAIALGGGQFVHAPAPGMTVEVMSYQWMPPSYAIRM